MRIQFFLKHPFHTRSAGFTLIELLVVISIIGLLGSIVLTSVNSARVKARDAKRRADLNQIYLALQLYFDDHGYLPTTASYGGSDPGGWDYSSFAPFLPFLQTGGYFPTVPVDPLNNGAGDVYYGGTGYAYAYYCYASENSLALGAKLENGEVIWKANHEPNFRCQ